MVDHAIPRGSAALVLAGPLLDATMSMTQPELVAESADAKRQQTIEATMGNVDLSFLPDGFLAGITNAEEPLSLTRIAKASETMIMKHHKAIVLYHQELKAQSEHITFLNKRLAAVEASTAAIKSDATGASNAAIVAHTVVSYH